MTAGRKRGRALPDRARGVGASEDGVPIPHGPRAIQGELAADGRSLVARGVGASEDGVPIPHGPPLMIVGEE